MRIKPLLTFLALTTILAFAACVPATPTIPRDTGSGGQATPGSGQTGGDSIPQTGGQGAMEDQVRQQVTQFLSQQLNAASNSIESITLMSTDWSDSCLGLGGANESCAQVVTPGWQVTARINGQDFVLRTNEDGSVIRMDNNAGNQNQGQGTGTGSNQGGQQGGTGIDGTTPGGNNQNQSGTQTPGSTGIDGTTPGNNNQNGTGNNNQGGSNNQSGPGTGGNLDPENSNDPSGRDIGGDDTRGSGNTAGSGLEVGDSGAGGNNTGGNTGGNSSGNNAGGNNAGNDTGGANNGNTGDNTAGGGSTVPNTGNNNEIMVFLVRENDNGQAGQRFGVCGDSLVGVPANVQMQQNGDLADMLRRTYDALLGLDQQLINDNSLTSVFQGTNLRLESVSVNQFGNAVVRFFGDLQLENDCDPDRVRYQLEQAARQFNGINDVEIFVNDQPLEDALPNSAAQPDQRQD